MNKRVEDNVAKLVDGWMRALMPGELITKSSAYSLERRILEFLEDYEPKERIKVSQRPVKYPY